MLLLHIHSPFEYYIISPRREPENSSIGCEYQVAKYSIWPLRVNQESIHISDRGAYSGFFRFYKYDH